MTEETIQTIICHFCGKDIPGHAVFCPKCGKKQFAEEHVPQPEAVVTHEGPVLQPEPLVTHEELIPQLAVTITQEEPTLQPEVRVTQEEPPLPLGVPATPQEHVLQLKDNGAPRPLSNIPSFPVQETNPSASCIYCGHPRIPNTNFCYFCGKPYDGALTPVKPHSENEASLTALGYPEGRIRFYPFLKIVQLLLRILGGINAILGLSSIAVMFLASSQVSSSLNQLNINTSQFFPGGELIAAGVTFFIVFFVSVSLFAMADLFQVFLDIEANQRQQLAILLETPTR